MAMDMQLPMDRSVEFVIFGGRDTHVVEEFYLLSSNKNPLEIKSFFRWIMHFSSSIVLEIIFFK